MRIGLIAYLLHQGADYRAAGVSVYTQRLLEHLPKVCPEHRYIAFHGTDAPRVKQIAAVVSPLRTTRPVVRIAWEQVVLPFELRRRHIDVVHGTVNVLPAANRKASVVTVHDLAFTRHPETFHPAKRWYLQAAVAYSARRATRVIAVSENTRRDLIDVFAIPERRIDVVYSGVSGHFRPLPSDDLTAFRRQALGGRPYLLHVGTLQPRKNIDVLIRAYAELRVSDGIPHALALVGARGWMYQNLFDLVVALHLEDHVHFIDYVAPDRLPLWYNCADLFVYPSAYEGFGLPVLEAMACGVPTITSDASSLKELAGQACLTVEPGSQEALQMAMARVLRDGGLQSTMRIMGLERAKLFSWEETARQTVEVYKQASGQCARV